MKVLVTGVNGQLGYDVVRELNKRNISCLGADRNDFDITDEKKTKKFILTYIPDVIIHCSAYTAVDKAEDEPVLCRHVNVDGTRNIAEACKQIHAKMVYISTDYVFDGCKEGGYSVDDQTNPQNIYGQTKYDGEQVVRALLTSYFIVRTSWAFGINGNNFVKTILKLAKENKVLNVVGDQYGSPTFTYDLAQLLCDMIETEKYGTYHATNSGICSWAEFAEQIIKDAGLKVPVKHISTEDYRTKAHRPHNSYLSKTKLLESGFKPLRDWHEALGSYIKLLEREKL